MTGKAGVSIAVAAGLAAAAGMGWWFASMSRAEPAPVIVLSAPPAPQAVLPPAPVPKSEVPTAQPSAKPEVEPVVERVAQPARRVAAKPHSARAAAPPPPVKLAVALVDPPSFAVAQPVRLERVAVAEPQMPRMAMLPVGTLITVRLNQELRSDQNAEGERFTATLDQPIVVDGLIIAERGSEQAGRIVALDPAVKAKGRPSIALSLTEFTTADGQRVEISTDSFTEQAGSVVKDVSVTVGSLAAIGAVIGAIAGGGKGAGIGAAIGGAAGAGTAMVKHSGPARLEAETRISFRVNKPVHLTERLN